MNGRQRMVATIRGEPTDALPWAPRMDLWAIALRARGTLPERFRGMGTAEIADELGVGCHAVGADWTTVPWDKRRPEDFIFRPFGFENHPDFPYRIELNDLPVAFRYEDRRDEGGVASYHTTIQTPAGDVETHMEYDDSMARAGITDPEVKTRVLESAHDLELAARVFEHFEVVPTPQAYWTFHERVGDRGLALAQGPVSASPMHAILHQLMDMQTFFYAYMDDAASLRRLSTRMTPFYDRLVDVLCESDAEVVMWGSNYDQNTTWPPFFAEEIVPWVARVGDRLRAAGKSIASHCDGENDGLLPYLPDCRLDIAESVCTQPMTRRTLDELRLGMGATTTIWGGLPAIAFMNVAMDDAAFERHLDEVFSKLGSGERLILGVSDNVPVDASLDRLDRVTERVKAFGPVILSPDGSR